MHARCGNVCFWDAPLQHNRQKNEKKICMRKERMSEKKWKITEAKLIITSNQKNVCANCISISIAMHPICVYIWKWLKGEWVRRETIIIHIIIIIIRLSLHIDMLDMISDQRIGGRELFIGKGSEWESESWNMWYCNHMDEWYDVQLEENFLLKTEINSLNFSNSPIFLFFFSPFYPRYWWKNFISNLHIAINQKNLFFTKFIF